PRAGRASRDRGSPCTPLRIRRGRAGRARRFESSWVDARTEQRGQLRRPRIERVEGSANEPGSAAERGLAVDGYFAERSTVGAALGRRNACEAVLADA